MATFRSWFRKVRQQKKLTQTEAAKQLKLSSPTISRWEDGGTSPRAEHLPRICKWAPITPDKLMALLE